MYSATITSLIVTTELAANRVGPRALDIPSVRSLFSGGSKATRESLTHQYSLPVVREMPPRSIRSAATW